MNLEFVIFLLAFLGFIGLAGNAVYASFGKYHRGIMALTAAIIAVHVVMVWAFRYEWHFSQATRNGYAGFLLFHSALSMIILSTIVSAAPARPLIMTAFVVVIMGAIGAVFIYEEVLIYRYPVILISLTGLYLMGKNGYRKYWQRGRGTAVGTSAPHPPGEGLKDEFPVFLGYRHAPGAVAKGFEHLKAEAAVEVAGRCKLLHRMQDDPAVALLPAEIDDTLYQVAADALSPYPRMEQQPA